LVNVTAPWYENFFNGIALDLWRGAVTPALTASDVDWLEREMGLGKGARLLDVPCGNGRHAIELASRGYEMVGLDISEEFIQEARGESAKRDLAIEFVLGDMQHLPVDGVFDGAYCFGNSFGYLDLDGTVDFLAALSRALKTGGRLAIDTGMAAESILPSLHENRWARVGDILFLAQSSYDVEASRLDTEYTFVRDGRTDTRKSSSLVFTVRELRSLLGNAGFETRTLHASPRGEPYELGSPQLMLIAQKK
jgi:SAM-dependent methyltransferase